MKKSVYTIALYSDDSADIRNFESIDDALAAQDIAEDKCTMLIHVGDIWSEIGVFFKILQSHSDRFLITEDTIQQLSDEFTNTEKVTTYYESKRHRPVGVFSIQLQMQEVGLKAHKIVDISDDVEAPTTNKWCTPDSEAQVETFDESDPFLQLQNAPDWLLDLKVSQLVQMKGRLGNTFRAHDINKVSDIMRYDAESMLKWPNFGKRSLTDLSKSLHATYQAYVWSNDEEYLFCDAVKDAIDSLDEKERMVFEKRFGLTCEPMTLEQIGEEQGGVTRERIRQIEQKAINKIRPYPLWSMHLVTRHLGTLLQHRDRPLFLDNLASEDSWFSGFEGSLECLADLIELFTDHSYSVFDVRSKAVICRIHEDAWKQQVSEILVWLKEQENSRLIETDIFSFIQSHLGQQEAGELAHELYAVISERLHFSASHSENEEAILTSVGHGYTPLVLSILREIPAPMHFREITRLRVQRDSSIDERRVQNILIEHACLYALGTYGSKEHLPIEAEEVERIKSYLAAIIFSGDPGRQWNCQGLLDQLQTEYPDVPAVVDKYIVNILLDELPGMKSLGRLIWVRKAQDTSSTQRIDLQEAATEVLMRSTGPMPIDDIKREISKTRGIGEYFLLKTTSQIAKVSKGVWGLIERDFFLGRNKINDLLNLLHTALHSRKRPIHMDEISSALNDEGYQLPVTVSEFMVMSLAQADSRFHLRRGNMLELSTWSNTSVKSFSLPENTPSKVGPFVELCGKNVVLTGTFKSMKRQEAKKSLEGMGVTVSRYVTSSVDYLIAGDGAASNSKYKMAGQLNTPILNEGDLIKFLQH